MHWLYRRAYIIHAYMHAYIHTYIHTYVHIYIHTYTTHTYIHIHTYITFTHTYIHTYIHTYTHTHTHTHTYIHTYTFTHTYMYTHFFHKFIYPPAPKSSTYKLQKIDQLQKHMTVLFAHWNIEWRLPQMVLIDWKWNIMISIQHFGMWKGLWHAFSITYPSQRS